MLVPATKDRHQFNGSPITDGYGGQVHSNFSTSTSKPEQDPARGNASPSIHHTPSAKLMMPNHPRRMAATVNQRGNRSIFGYLVDRHEDIKRPPERGDSARVGRKAGTKPRPSLLALAAAAGLLSVWHRSAVVSGAGWAAGLRRNDRCRQERNTRQR